MKADKDALKTMGEVILHLGRTFFCEIEFEDPEIYRNTFKVLRCVDLSGGPSGKEPACQCRRQKRHDFNPWVGKMPWRRTWQLTPEFLPGECHGPRSLAGYSS